MNRACLTHQSGDCFSECVRRMIFDADRGRILAVLGLLIVMPVPIHAAESPTGKVVYSRAADLWVMNPDGTEPHFMGLRKLDGALYDPSWSPGGTQIVFSRTDNLFPSTTELFAVNADGTNLRQLTKAPQELLWPYHDMTPAWSPDGTQIAFASSRDNDWEIYIMDADGQNQTNLTQSPGTIDLTPGWSPNNEQIAYSSNGELYILHLKTGQKEQLPHKGERCGQPAWSPDGMWIAFTATLDGDTTNVYVIAPDGKNERRLTDPPGNNGDPTWSPDGAQIVFQSERDQRVELYRLTLQSGKVERLTNRPGLDSDPDWSRPAVPPNSVGPVGRKWVIWGTLRSR